MCDRQLSGLTHICKQGGTESGTVVDDSRLLQTKISE
jgi:hypothetical protein